MKLNGEELGGAGGVSECSVYEKINLKTESPYVLPDPNTGRHSLPPATFLKRPISLSFYSDETGSSRDYTTSTPRDWIQIQRTSLPPKFL